MKEPKSNSNNSSTKANVEFEELYPEEDHNPISYEEVQALLASDAPIVKITAPGLIIFSPVTPYLKAAIELQCAEDLQKQNFAEGIIALTRLAIQFN